MMKCEDCTKTFETPRREYHQVGQDPTDVEALDLCPYCGSDYIVNLPEEPPVEIPF